MWENFFAYWNVIVCNTHQETLQISDLNYVNSFWISKIKKVFFCKSARGYCVTFFAQFNADQTYNFKKIVTKDWEEKYGVILVL